MALVLGMVPACHHAGEDHDHEHEHHHDAEQYTAYGADFELFAEAEPFVVGQESEVAAHLTRLSNFKPLDSTQVKISLVVMARLSPRRLTAPSSQASINALSNPPRLAVAS